MAAVSCIALGGAPLALLPPPEFVFPDAAFAKICSRSSSILATILGAPVFSSISSSRTLNLVPVAVAVVVFASVSFTLKSLKNDAISAAALPHAASFQSSSSSSSDASPSSSEAFKLSNVASFFLFASRSHFSASRIHSHFSGPSFLPSSHMSKSVDIVGMWTLAPSVNSITFINALADATNLPVFAEAMAKFSHVCHDVR
mmetsp:Transcript_4848/g.15607  ORF Transcript_4848/g.15607 Transcript_4848/m.15607 type:complete len:201 (+) Transcript_4848:1708-2310(+)